MKLRVFYSDGRMPRHEITTEAPDHRAAAQQLFSQHPVSTDRRINAEAVGGDYSIQQFQAREFMDDTMRASLPTLPVMSSDLCPRASTQCYVHTGELQTGPYLPEQIKTMWRSGAITADATLSWDGHAERVPIPTVLKNQYFGSADRFSPTSAADTEADTSTPHPLPLIAAGAMLVGFFLPWAQLLGFGASGYNLGQLGSYGNLAWIIPVAAALVIVLNLSVPEARPLQVIAGMIPWGALFYGLAQAGSNLFQVLSIGPYIILTAGLVLILCPSRVPSKT